MTRLVWPPASDQLAVRIAVSALITAPMIDIFLCGILLVQGYAYLAKSGISGRCCSSSSISGSIRRPTSNQLPMTPRHRQQQAASPNPYGKEEIVVNANIGQTTSPTKRLAPAKTLTAHSSYLLLFLLIFSLFKTGCSFAMLYEAVFHEGDNWLSLGTQWPYYSGPLLTAIVGLTVQFFYIHRLYFLFRAQTGKILGNLWIQIVISGVIALLALTSFVTIVISTHLVRTGQWAIYVYYSMIHLVAASLGDLLITSVTILCIQRANRRTVHPRKRSRIQQIARLTAVSAAVPTLLAIINVILVINPDKDVARWHIVPNFLLCKLYVFSLLWTLEYRRRIILSEWSDNKRPVEQPHAQQGNGGKKDVRSSSDDTSEAIDARGGNAGASPAALAGATGGSGRKRGVEDLVERAGGKATRYPIRMEVITDEQGERRTSLGFLNRTSMFARTVMTPTGTEITGEETDQVAADLESQWDAVNSREMERKKKYGEMSVIDSLDTARWEEKIGRDG